MKSKPLTLLRNIKQSTGLSTLKRVLLDICDTRAFSAIAFFVVAGVTAIGMVLIMIGLSYSPRGQEEVYIDNYHGEGVTNFRSVPSQYIHGETINKLYSLQPLEHRMFYNVMERKEVAARGRQDVRENPLDYQEAIGYGHLLCNILRSTPEPQRFNNIVSVYEDLLDDFIYANAYICPEITFAPGERRGERQQ